ncbi:MAG: hypothetical protein AAFQ35_07315 [Pseudomonadota bacterium]
MGDGVKAAVSGHAPNPPRASEEQLTMLPSGPLPASSPELADATARGPGRPKGSQNKATQEVAAYYLQRFTCPLEFLLRTMSTDTKMLAEEHGVDAEKALGMRVSAAQSALPYLRQKQPTAVELPPGTTPVLVLNLGGNQGSSMHGSAGAGAPGADAAATLTLTADPIRTELTEEDETDQETEEFQRFSEADPTQSDGKQSDGS